MVGTIPLIILLIFGKSVAIIQKKTFGLYPTINIYAMLTLISIISIIIVNCYCLGKDITCYNNIFNDVNRGGLLLILLCGIILGFVKIYYYPLYKRYDYTTFKILKDPINMAIVIIGGVLFLGERPGINTYIGLMLFLLGAYISHKDLK